ncbi:hypothetical protein BV25DRAFT_1692549 [Artomyces pyxidatus]|uniref:Uncharacterized protein n=1 Tax=Artomyces pyxidatus TaxID=48021 RepID=A0ACB8TAW0_9AGAM|nr:hypothetical protein BV25DRAFT_1692549 [Artomyces pyxidatus]
MRRECGKCAARDAADGRLAAFVVPETVSPCSLPSAPGWRCGSAPQLTAQTAAERRLLELGRQYYCAIVAALWLRQADCDCPLPIWLHAAHALGSDIAGPPVRDAAPALRPATYYGPTPRPHRELPSARSAHQPVSTGDGSAYYTRVPSAPMRPRKPDSPYCGPRRRRPAL